MCWTELKEEHLDVPRATHKAHFRGSMRWRWNGFPEYTLLLTLREKKIRYSVAMPKCCCKRALFGKELRKVLIESSNFYCVLRQLSTTNIFMHAPIKA